MDWIWGVREEEGSRPPRFLSEQLVKGELLTERGTRWTPVKFDRQWDNQREMSSS